MYVYKDVFKMDAAVLTLGQKQRVIVLEHWLELFEPNKKDFLCRHVTIDETWMPYYTPASNRQSAEWRKADESRPKKSFC